MKIYYDLNAIPAGELHHCVLTIGNFDGVHRGHRALLGQTAQIARDHQGMACALTFWPHPRSIVGRGAPVLVSTLQQRIDWIASTGIDVLVVQTFDNAFSQTEPETFLELLRTHLDIRHLILGDDFHFGRGGRGNVALARDLSTKLGFEVSVCEPVFLNESVVSSSHVREALDAGDVRKAHEYLGRPWQIRGQSISGAGRGRTLGFPTVNFATGNELCVPDGVYGGRILLADGSAYIAAISVGTNPTFGDEPRHAEAYILDCENPDVDGELTLEFLSYIRTQVTYTDAARLIEQIQNDVEVVREQAGGEHWLVAH